MNKNKVSQQTWFTIVMLILFFPVGLYLMWKNKKFSKATRVRITGVLAILSIIVYFSKGHTQENVPAKQVTEIETNADTQFESEDAIAASDNSSEEVVTDNIDDSSEEVTTDDSNASSEEVTTDDSNVSSNTVTSVEVSSDTFLYQEKEYKIIEVDGGDLSGHREANVAVDIGFGDREYWGLTNEYGQLVYVIANQVILQDENNEPVKSNGRYYNDEAKVPGTEQANLDEGHVIADSLGGVSNAYNITPQDSTLNRHGDQAYMEKVIRDAGGCENFLATITYDDTSTQIPSMYRYEYILNGEPIVDEFPNGNPDKANAELIAQQNQPQATTSKQNEETESESAASGIDEATELKKIDTNGNGKITIAEAKAAGYKMPIKSDHWLYKYMDDRDGDGIVGE